VIGFAARAPLEESVVTVAKSDGAAKNTSFPPYYRPPYRGLAVGKNARKAAFWRCQQDSLALLRRLLSVFTRPGPKAVFKAPREGYVIAKLMSRSVPSEKLHRRGG
jgi:hypothetical protein